jgi:hypothetical protein
MRAARLAPRACFFQFAFSQLAVSVSPLREPTSHARSAWWLETNSYAPIALEHASTALADSRWQTQKFPYISFARLLPPPLRRKAGNEGKEIFGFASPLPLEL